jgi:hypothetical protein
MTRMLHNTRMQTVSRFGAANRGTSACQFCGVLSWASRQDETANRAMCQGCYDAAGYENEHQDGYHADRAEPLCPTCNPEREQRRLAKAAERVEAYGQAAAARAAKATERAEAKAAAEALIKRCQHPGCSDRVTAKASAYCSFHRDEHPHEYLKGGKPLRDAVAHIEPQYRRYPAIDPGLLCKTCFNPADHALHQEPQS